ncbi:3002_t:CDS:2, partial [Racocetra persica]
ASKRNLRKKKLRTIKKAKIEKSDSSIVGEGISNSNANHIEESTNIFYDPLKHKTQSESCLSKSKSRKYILSYWKSEDFIVSDLKSKNDLQSIFLIDPKITFFKKFAERRWQREVIKMLLDQELLLLDAITTTPNHTNYSSHFNYLSNICEFIDLLESEIFDHTKPTNKNSDLAWKQFTLWAFFAISSSIVKQIRNHCQCLWSKIKHAHQQHVKAEKVSLKQTTISEALCRNLKDKQIIAS